jgi:hypothetical protein
MKFNNEDLHQTLLNKFNFYSKQIHMKIYQIVHERATVQKTTQNKIDPSEVCNFQMVTSWMILDLCNM